MAASAQADAVPAGHGWRSFGWDAKGQIGVGKGDEGKRQAGRQTRQYSEANQGEAWEMRLSPEERAGSDVAALWGYSRSQCEDLYADAWEKGDLDALRWLARNDRYFLLTTVLRRPDVRQDWVFDRCREVEKHPDGFIDLWARSHFKSSLITFGGSIQEIIKDPEITIGIFSHIRPAAKDFLIQLKHEMEDNQALKDLFPDIFWQDPQKEALGWSEDGGLIVKRKSNPKEATLEAWGLVDGMPTGKHFLLRIYDDLVTEKAVSTADMINKVTTAFDLSDYLGVVGKGRIWIIGSRYHHADTYGRLIKRGVYIERRYPATDTGKFDGKPVFLTEDQWALELKKPRSVVAAQMLLNPIEGSEKRFDPRWLQFWLVRPKRLNVYITVDPSKGTHETGDNTAIVVTGMDVAKNKYVLDGWCHRMPLSRRWELVRNAWKRWSTTPGVELVRVGYEQFGMQTDIEYFKERMQQEKIFLPIEELKWPRTGPASKTHRIERLEPDIRMGRMRLPAVIDVDEEGNIHQRQMGSVKIIKETVAAGEEYRTCKPLMKMDEDKRLYDFLAKLIEEYVFFPAGHDDIMDAGSRIYDLEPLPPIHYGDGPDAENPTEPDIFFDGV